VRHRRNRRGFTLIELLVVIAIIVLLASFLIVGLFPQRDKAFRSKTQALIDSVSAALALYYNEFHDYPPDGYDTEPNWQKAGAYGGGHNNTTNPGILLGDRCSGQNAKKYVYYGSGCLIYFLCYPINNVTIVGADQGVPDPRNIRISPCNKGQAFLTTLKKDDFSVSAYDDSFDPGIEPGSTQYKGGNSSGPGAWNFGEIVDAYRYPIHYDKVGNVPDYTKDLTYFQPNTFAHNMKCHSDQYYLTNSIAGQWTAGPNNDVESNCCPSNNPAHTPGGTGGVTHADPRVPPEPDGCFIDTPSQPNPQYANQANPAPRNPGSFDLWAHGKYFANGVSALTNWK
jgi:prepilin-type N-terminal cleavage/methylation domain-containing protein